DVPLVSLEEFRNTAPEHLITSATDDHQLMLNRLQFELDERKRYDAEKRRLLAVKVQLKKANKARGLQIKKVEEKLKEYIKSSQSLEPLFQEPIVPILTRDEILTATTSSTLTPSGSEPANNLTVPASATATTTTTSTTTTDLSSNEESILSSSAMEIEPPQLKPL
ncbi:hypothetical protein BX616_007295, partial [Lobosporangium transversale]